MTTGVADLKHDGILVSDSTKKAEILNQQFTSVFTVEKAGDLPDLGDSPYENITRLTISDGSKAQGSDEIPPWFLKLAAEDIYCSISYRYFSNIC